jgi:hypothetical protein
MIPSQKPAIARAAGCRPEPQHHKLVASRTSGSAITQPTDYELRYRTESSLLSRSNLVRIPDVRNIPIFINLPLIIYPFFTFYLISTTFPIGPEIPRAERHSSAKVG